MSPSSAGVVLTLMVLLFADPVVAQMRTALVTDGRMESGARNSTQIPQWREYPYTQTVGCGGPRWVCMWESLSSNDFLQRTWRYLGLTGFSLAIILYQRARTADRRFKREGFGRGYVFEASVFAAWAGVALLVACYCTWSLFSNS